MNNKPIYDCYQELKQREIRELEDAVRKAGGSVEFDEDSAPIVIVNFDGYMPHPADVRIVRVKLSDDKLHIDGCEKEASGCAQWFGDEKPIDVNDICGGHILYITDDITAGNVMPEWDSVTGCLSDGAWCAIDTDEQTWEYQSDATDDDTYISGSYGTDEDDEKTVTDYDGAYLLPSGVKAALKTLGYKLDL